MKEWNMAVCYTFYYILLMLGVLWYLRFGLLWKWHSHQITLFEFFNGLALCQLLGLALFRTGTSAYTIKTKSRFHICIEVHLNICMCGHHQLNWCLSLVWHQNICWTNINKMQTALQFQSEWKIHFRKQWKIFFSIKRYIWVFHPAAWLQWT